MSGQVAASSPDQKIVRRQSDVVGRELADGEGGRWSVRVVGARPTMTASSRRQTGRRGENCGRLPPQLSSELRKWWIGLPGLKGLDGGGGGYTRETVACKPPTTLRPLDNNAGEGTPGAQAVGLGPRQIGATPNSDQRVLGIPKLDPEKLSNP